MRIVRWAPSERVDIPDITAMSFLVLGEFRRTMRALVTGDASYVVQGFKVEPEAPATTRIRVRLQPPGEFKGAALGGEQITPGLDYGQLIGNRDSSFLDEGASQQFIDFVGQPVGTYIIEMRFVYTSGVSDNRAFWNAGTSSEFVAVTDTRHVSGWQIQRVAAPTGGQWIPLASVAWGGVTVVAGDITDLRTFLFEGVSPYTRATQEGAGGVEDFSRATTRADDAVGRFRTREVVRALMRQVQDLKGANDAGVWDWFSRVYRPWDPAGALNAQRTKSLRTIDTVTYTVGDGTTVIGDFNGATGLEACLDHIEALAAGNRPERIEIVVHGGTTGYTITTPKFLQGGAAQQFTVIIRGGTTNSQTNVGLDGRPRVAIDGNGITATNFAIVSGNGGNLVLRDLDVLWTGATSDRHMFGAGGWLQAENCRFFMTSPAVDAGNVLFSSFARRSRIVNCDITGRVQFYDVGTAIARADASEGCLIAHSRLDESQIRLSDVSASGDQNVAVGCTLRDCTIKGRTTAQYTASVALIDGRSSTRLRVEGCQITHGINENGLDGRTFEGAEVFQWVVRNTAFFSDVSNGTHTPSTGQNGASGTGWAINIESTTNGAQNITIDNVRFGLDSTDAGGIRLHNVTGAEVRGVDFSLCTHGAGGSDTFQAIQVTASAVNWLAAVKILGGHIWKWLGGVRTRGIRLVNVDDVEIVNLTMHGDKFDATSITGRPAQSCAVWIEDSDNVRIHDNKMHYWEPAGTSSRTIVMDTGAAHDLSICRNQFRENGNYSIDLTPTSHSGLGPTVNDNQWRCASANELGTRIDISTGFWTFNNNRGQMVGAVDFLFVGTALAAVAVAMGNVSDGVIRVAGGGANLRGYNEAGQDLNNVGGYT